MRAHAIFNFACIFLLDRDHCTNLSPGLCIILLLCASAFGDSTNKQKKISTKRTPYKALANHQQPPHHLIKRTPPLLSLSGRGVCGLQTVSFVQHKKMKLPAWSETICVLDYHLKKELTSWKTDDQIIWQFHFLVAAHHHHACLLETLESGKQPIFFFRRRPRKNTRSCKIYVWIRSVTLDTQLSLFVNGNCR